jgi:hypothetical protein
MTHLIVVGNEEHDLDTMTRAEILALKIDLEEQMDKIQQQIYDAKTRAHTHGEYADPDWFSRASYARKAKGRQAQKIQAYLGSMKRSRTNTFEKAFIDVARIHLQPETFQFLLDEARDTGGEK